MIATWAVQRFGRAVVLETQEVDANGGAVVRGALTPCEALTLAKRLEETALAIDAQAVAE